MPKIKYILLIAILSTMLCACTNGKQTSTSEYKELNPEYENTSSVNDESTETEEHETVEKENVMDASAIDTSIAEFLPSNTCTFAYDPVYDLITVDGVTYTIATNEMDYSGGYMPYYMANSTMEDIVECINNGDLSDTSWRDGCSDKLQEKINESDLLERFVNSGGKILDYYVINGNFYGSFDDAEMPVIIHYSIGEEKYYSIWGFYMQKIMEPEQSILYQMADIFQIDNLDGHTPEITEFRLGRNLETAISELALMYYFFDASKVEGNEYASDFISRFLQNSRCSFGYLEQLREEKKGILSLEDVEYIQQSLTNQMLDFGEVVPPEGININQNTKGEEWAEISSYEAEIDGDKVHLAVTLKRRPDEFSLVEYYDLNVVLMKNPESCFEGYSILSFTSEDVTNREHTFLGYNLGMEENGVFVFENYGGQTNIEYDYHTQIDLSLDNKLASFVRANPGKEFEVTYILDKNMSEPVCKVVPVQIRLYERDIDISRFSSEDFYLLSTNQEFYDEILCNPLMKGYLIQYDGAAEYVLEEFYEKGDAWNQQMEYTANNLTDLLKDGEADTLQKIVDLWKDYYQEKISLCQILFGRDGLIPGSTYDQHAVYNLVQNNTLIACALLSLEYELSGGISFVEERDESILEDDYFFQSGFGVVLDWNPIFDEMETSYLLDEKNGEELETVITEAAARIQEKMGSAGDLVTNVDMYLSVINLLNELEKGISTDDRYIKVKEQRLRSYAIELLNIESLFYMLEES